MCVSYSDRGAWLGMKNRSVVYGLSLNFASNNKVPLFSHEIIRNFGLFQEEQKLIYLNSLSLKTTIRLSLIEEPSEIKFRQRFPFSLSNLSQFIRTFSGLRYYLLLLQIYLKHFIALIEVVYVTFGNPAFCLLYLTGVHFRSELQHFSDVSEQKMKY